MLTFNDISIDFSQNPPYNMLKESSTLKVGNDQYEGFAIEIIQELSKLLHFNYTFIETDPDYGSLGKDGKWSGMLGAIIAGVSFIHFIHMPVLNSLFFSRAILKVDNCFSPFSGSRFGHN